jgi:hypothetical protein
MRAFPELELAAAPRSQPRPRLDSCDSGEEFSFHHWIQVCGLVYESGLEETRSEVESPAAYQDLAGDII